MKLSGRLGARERTERRRGKKVRLSYGGRVRDRDRKTSRRDRLREEVRKE